MTQWHTVGSTTAKVCGHTIAVQTATNDAGEEVTRTAGYPNPDGKPFQYDALDLCQPCYFAAMDRHPMTFEQMTAAWKGN